MVPEKLFDLALAICRKYCETKWVSSENGSTTTGKLREQLKACFRVFAYLLLWQSQLFTRLVPSGGFFH
jgi:hypothetical protein